MLLISKIAFVRCGGAIKSQKAFIRGGGHLPSILNVYKKTNMYKTSFQTKNYMYILPTRYERLHSRQNCRWNNYIQTLWFRDDPKYSGSEFSNGISCFFQCSQITATHSDLEH